MGKKDKDGKKLSISIRFSPIQYYQLKKLADIHNRSLNDEVLSLIEKLAANMKMKLDQEDEGIRDYIRTEAERLGIPLEDAAEKVKKRYDERQRHLLDDIRYPEIFEAEEKKTGTTGRY